MGRNWGQVKFCSDRCRKSRNPLHVDVTS
ncbi:DUF2256 domain-containing protein [Novosphingobium gossypii]